MAAVAILFADLLTREQLEQLKETGIKQDWTEAIYISLYKLQSRFERPITEEEFNDVCCCSKFWRDLGTGHMCARGSLSCIRFL